MDKQDRQLVSEQVKAMEETSGWGYVHAALQGKINDYNNEWWKADEDKLKELVVARKAIEEVYKTINNLKYVQPE